MDEFMKTVIDRLRSERCPEHVLEKVERSIAARPKPAFGHRRVHLAWATAVVILALAAAILVLKPGPSREPAQATLSESPPATGRTAREAYASLASIGLVLREAGSRSGTIILQETLPVLRRGLETTQNAIEPKTKS